MKLIDRVGRSLGSPLSWSAAAAAMDVASHHTAQSYVKALAESFALLIIHYCDVQGSFEPRKQRKVYFIDPLFADVYSAAASGVRTAPADGILEGCVPTFLLSPRPCSSPDCRNEPSAD